MNPRDQIGILVLVLILAVLLLIMRSNSALGRWLRIVVRADKQARRQSLSGWQSPRTDERNAGDVPTGLTRTARGEDEPEA